MTSLNERERELGVVFDQAIAARHEGDLDRAEALCKALLSILVESDRRVLMAVHNELAHLSRLRSDWGAAAAHYRNAVAVAPRSELSSLGLFHSLARQGHLEDALAEAVRFLELRDSGEYRQLLSSGFRDDLPPSARRLADEARRLLDRS